MYWPFSFYHHTRFIHTGSSNDVLEFCPNPPNGRIIELKRGPKAYTYGCFVKAIDYFLEESNFSDDSNNHNDIVNDMDDNNKGFYGATCVDDDMEAFLNACDENDYGEGEEEDDECMMNLYGDGDSGGDCSGNMGIGNNEYGDNEGILILKEIQALSQFIIALEKTRQTYSSFFTNIEDVEVENKSNSKSVTSGSSTNLHEDSCKKYSAILVQSEMQTLYLYELAARLIRARLQSNQKKDIMSDDQDDESISYDIQKIIVQMCGEESWKLIHKHALELLEAYYRIRHQSL